MNKDLQSSPPLPIVPITVAIADPLTAFFGQYITEKRKLLIEQVLDQRTRYLTVVLEDIYQSHNASAVVRTCECLGIQDIHVIETRSRYSTNPKVLMGSSKWVDLIRYRSKRSSNVEACYAALRKSGYCIVAADPAGSVDVADVPSDQKMAVVMGNELNGLSEYALSNATIRARIPMFGFTESFNISVSAAICMSSLMTRIRSSPVHWQLGDQEKSELRLAWYRRCVKNPQILERAFLEKARKS